MDMLSPGDAAGRLLIVDDDAINRGLLSLIFSPYYHIQEAEDGPSGLAAVLDGPERLCAVLLDVVMPGLDGLQVLERLAGQEGWVLRGAACGAAAVALAARRAAQSADSGSSRCMAETS